MSAQLYQPGWYPDPSGRFEFRFHNGSLWTADVSTNGQRYVDPLGAATQRPVTAVPAAVPAAPAPNDPIGHAQPIDDVAPVDSAPDPASSAALPIRGPKKTKVKEVIAVPSSSVPISPIRDPGF